MTNPAKDFWDNLGDKHSYIRSYGEGVGVPSRDWLHTQVRDGESLLDVGCGPGCTYENLLVHDRSVTYRGLDFAQGFVDVCREMFPGGDFRLGDACELDEPDDSFDVVLLRHVLENTPGYQIPLEEAYRVARKRVVVVLWRALTDRPTSIKSVVSGDANDYNRSDFESFILSAFLRPLEHHHFPGGRPNWAYVVHKRQASCVFDLDDFHDDAPGQDLLLSLQERFPKLKVTLFTIPGRSTRSHLERWASLDWVELAVHGWNHEPNQECLTWNREAANELLERAEAWGTFVKGFRAPGWQVNDETLLALEDRGYWIAPNIDQKARMDGFSLPAYYTHWYNPLSVHGHFEKVNQQNPLLRNGLRQLVEERGLPWDQDTEFSFVSEVVE